MYIVTHQGGSTPVVINQRVNGGQWVLLGSFPFEASGSGYKVELRSAIHFAVKAALARCVSQATGE